MSDRAPSVAGLFYPADRRILARDVEAFLRQGERCGELEAPKAVVAPHAGYVYSGPIAGSSFAALEAGGARIERVVLLGPSHFVPFSGLALPGVEGFVTPLGRVEVDRSATDAIRNLPQVGVLPAAHGREHCLEVELPFLQVMLDRFTLVPLVVGAASPSEVGEVLERLWGGEETLIVISTDLSHYLDYETARRQDEETSRLILSLQHENLLPDQACGAHALNGLVFAARRRHLRATLLDLRSSGDTAGPRDQVVGYGAYAVS